MRSSKGRVWRVCALVLMTLFPPHFPCYARPSPTKGSFGCTLVVADGQLGGRSCRKWNNDVTDMFVAPGNDPVSVACTLEKAPPGSSMNDISVRVVSASLDLVGKPKNINNQPHHSVTTDPVWLTRAQLDMEPIINCQVRGLDLDAKGVMRYVRISVGLRRAEVTSPAPVTEAKKEQASHTHIFVPKNTSQLAMDSNVSLPPLDQGTLTNSTLLTDNGSIPANEPDLANDGCTNAIVVVAAAVVVGTLLFATVAAICVRHRRCRKRRRYGLKTPVDRASELFGSTLPASMELLPGATASARFMSQTGEGGIKPWTSSAGPPGKADQLQQVSEHGGCRKQSYSQGESVLDEKQNELGASADDEVSSPADAELTVANPATPAFVGGNHTIVRSISLPSAGQKPTNSARKRPKSVQFRPDSFQAVSASCPSSPQSPLPTTPQSPPAATTVPPPPLLLENKQSTMGPTGTVEEGEHQAHQHRRLPAQGMGWCPMSLQQPGRPPIPGRAVPKRTQSVLFPAGLTAVSRYPARQYRSQPDVAAAAGQISPPSPTCHPTFYTSQPCVCSSQRAYVSQVPSQHQAQLPHQGSVQSVQGDHGEDQLQERPPPPAQQRPSSPPQPPPPTQQQQPSDGMRFECPVGHGSADVCLIPVGEWSGVCVPGYCPFLTAVTPEPGRYWPGGYAYPASSSCQPLSPVAEANVSAESTLDDMQQSA